MNVEAKIKREQRRVIGDMERIKKLEKGGFFSKSRFFKAIRGKSIEIIVTSIMMLAANMPNATNRQIMENIGVAQTKMRMEKSQDKAAERLTGILLEIDDDIENDVRNSRFDVALRKIDAYLRLAEVLKEKKLFEDLLIAKRDIETRFYRRG